MTITERTLMLEARDHNDKGSLEMLLNQQRPLDLQVFWEATWQIDCCQKRNTSNVVHEYANMYLSEDMLEKMREYSNADFDDGDPLEN
jgi:hypothetical protein